MTSMTLFAVEDFPLIQPGDDLAAVIAARLAAMNTALQKDDIVIIAQKIVSKAEGRLRKLDEIEAGAEAERLAAVTDKDPRMVQAVLDDSTEVIRARPGLLITEQKSGWICANAGVDRSNVVNDNATGEEVILLLPNDADASAASIRRRLAELTGVAPGILICDSHGRPWRIGTVGITIGCAGLPPLWDQRGRHDLFGYELVASEECIVDELAAAASLIMGQGAEGRPVVIVRGYSLPNGAPHAPASRLQRPKAMDVFR